MRGGAVAEGEVDEEEDDVEEDGKSSDILALEREVAPKRRSTVTTKAPEKKTKKILHLLSYLSLFYRA